MRKKKKEEGRPSDSDEAKDVQVMDTNPADQVFFPEMYTRQQSYYNDTIGDSTAQAAVLMARPNAYMSLVNGGAVRKLARDASDEPYGIWYHSEVDTVVAGELFQRLDLNVRRRILYRESDVLVYLVELASMVAKYVSVVSWYSHLSSNVGTLGDLHDAIPALTKQMVDPVNSRLTYLSVDGDDPPSSVISESTQWIEMVATTLETFAFPSEWLAEIVEVYQMHRLGPFEDSPVGGFMPNSGSGAAHLLPAISGGKNIIPTIRELWAQVQAFRATQYMQKISADLQSGPGMGTLSLSREMNGEPFSLPWMDLWYNNGFIHDDANTLNTNDSLIPNASRSDEGKRYTLPFDFLVAPTDMFLTNAAWGLGDEYSGIRGYHLANLAPNVFPNYGEDSDDIDASANALGVLGFTAGDPTATPAVRRVDSRIALGYGALTAAGLRTLSDIIASSQNALSNLVGQENRLIEVAMDGLMEGMMFVNGALGWKRVLQGTNSALTDDFFEGFVPEHPQVGRRYYADPFTIQSHAYDRYRSLIGLK